MLSVLEGGYDCKVGGGLQSSVEQHLRALARAPRASSAGTKRGRRRREVAAQGRMRDGRETHPSPITRPPASCAVPTVLLCSSSSCGTSWPLLASCVMGTGRPRRDPPLFTHTTRPPPLCARGLALGVCKFSGFLILFVHR